MKKPSVKTALQRVPDQNGCMPRIGTAMETRRARAWMLVVAGMVLLSSTVGVAADEEKNPPACSCWRKQRAAKRPTSRCPAVPYSTASSPPPAACTSAAKTESFPALGRSKQGGWAANRRSTGVDQTRATARFPTNRSRPPWPIYD